MALAGLTLIFNLGSAQAGANDRQASPSTNGAIQEEVFDLDDFSVTASEDIGYFSAFTTSTTRTNTTVRNSPISLTIINEELMEDLNILNDEDLARATASVTLDPDGFSFNQIRIRGFRSLTQRFDLFWREIERDGYNIQRMDIVKGANSLIFGQADPGGVVNAIPKKAVHGNSFYNLSAAFGNKNFQRFVLDANMTVTDKFAVRLMAFDMDRDFDQLYKTLHQRGATLDLGYRLNRKTHFRVRYERMETEHNLPPRMFSDATGQSRYLPNSLGDETDTQKRASLTAYRNEFIFNPDAVQYIPQEVIDNLVLVNNPNPTREDIAALYAPWADDRNALYSSTGPDKVSIRTGDIYTFDVVQKFTDNMQLKLAYNREDDDRYALTRMGFSNSRVQGAIGEEYIQTHWQRNEGRTLANAFKGTFLWELELDDVPIIGNSRHNILLGYDWDNLKKSPRLYEQIKEGTQLFDGNYYATEIYHHRLPLANGFGPDAPNIGYNNRDDLFQLRQKSTSDVTTHGYWLAVQSEFLNGRLRTLAGLRYDKVDITHSYNNYAISVAPGYFTNPNFELPPGLTPETITTRVSDNNVPYDQWSPTIGGLFWITEQVGVFANYAKSTQSPDGTSLDPFGDVIPPVFGEGVEFGLRFDLLDGKLNGQIIAFYIEKENDAIVNYDFRLSDIITYEEYGEEYPNYFFYDTRPGEEGWKLQNNALPGRQIAGDMSRAQGFDVEFYYNPTRNFSVVFSYTYNDLEAIKINENVNERFGRIFGLAPHNAIVHLRYQFRDGPLDGFSFGASQSFRSKSTMASYYVDELDRWFDVDLDREYSTSGFIRYTTRLGQGPSSKQLTVNYSVNNLFNSRDLMNRHRGAFYRESIQHQLQANLRF